MDLINENKNLIIYAVAIILVAFVSLWIFKWRFGKKNTLHWDNGNIKNIYFTKKIGKVGQEKFFYRNGKINKIQNWSNNKLNGLSNVYYNSGKKYIECNYKQGQLEGKYIVFSSSGSVIRDALFENGIEKSIILDNTNYEEGSFENLFIEDNTPLISNYLVKIYEKSKLDYHFVKNMEETKDEDREDDGFLMRWGKKISGVSAIQNRKSSINLKESCEKLYKDALNATEDGREKLSKKINEFGTQRLSALRNTTGRFLGMLKDMNQKNSIKEYQILNGIGIHTQEIQKMEQIDMATSKALQSTATVGALGAAAAMGTSAMVPGAVFSAVSAVGAASTGTAISSLSGIAATNATLAWLGGGTLASGGGGMAAGAATLATITTVATATATAGVGLIAAGLIASTYFTKKLTEAKEYQKEVEIKVADMEKLWVLMEGINTRTNELNLVTAELEKRLTKQLELLEPLTINYNSTDSYYNTVFQRTGILAKSMSELAQAPLLDEYGNASNESAEIVEQTQKILNTKLVNHG